VFCQHYFVALLTRTDLQARKGPPSSRPRPARGSMDLEDRVNQLASQHDWQAVVAVLEHAIQTAEDASVKADLHLRLGQLLHQQFLQGVKALKHFQDAYKLNPALVNALAEARRIYWELGKLNMVQKLIRLELKAGGEATQLSQLYRELWDVLCDQGDYDGATEAYAKALQNSNGHASEIPDLLEDVQVGQDQWQDRIGGLLRSGHEATEASEKSRVFLRAARIARRFAPGELEGILAQAYSADPASVSIAALYEGLLVEADRTDAILETQEALLKELRDPSQKADASFCFGVRWALRHQNAEVGARFLETALRLDPAREPAFTYLRENLGNQAGDWDYVVGLADELADRSGAGSSAVYLLASGGLIAWREQGDLIKAKRFFVRLAQLDPSHPALQAFEQQ